MRRIELGPVCAPLPVAAARCETGRMTELGSRSVVSRLSAATAPPAWMSGAALTVLRLLVGLMWLHNLLWKVPPDFGEKSRGGLYFWTRLGVDFPVFAPFSWLLEHVVLPNFTPFGWLTLVVETSLAVLLLTGTAVRLAALIGIGQSAAIGLTVAVAPHEWSWAYAMMIGIHLVLLLTASARYGSVDAVWAATAAGEGARASRRLLLGWGVVLVLIGVAAGIMSSAKGFRAPVGDVIGYVAPDSLEVSVGQYNMLAALIVLAVGVLMLVGALLRSRVVALAAGLLALAAAVSIYVQLGRTEVWLGGTASTAAVFLCGAVVAAATAKPLTVPPSGTKPTERDGD
jgi:hypothetical protein